MNQLLKTLFFCTCIQLQLHAQEPVRLIHVTGTIYSPDTVAIEDAYLISYKTLRAFATNAKGEFDILLQPDDSLKIHHVSYKSIVIKPDYYSNKFEIVMDYEDNTIGDVLINEGTIEIENMKLNMMKTMHQLNNEYKPSTSFDSIVNPYAPKNPSANVVRLNIFDVIKWIKYKQSQ